MKILHLGDLHIGKRVNDFSMLEDQEFVLNQATSLIKKEKIKALLISGDVFDKPVASIEAINLFCKFLEDVNKLNTKIYIIPGNHDNSERLNYLSSFAQKSDIYFAKTFEGEIQKFDLDNEIVIYLMPYLYPAIIKKYYPDIEFKSYNDAIKKVVDDIKLDNKKTNILVAHQFVTGKNQKIIHSESEQKQAGLIDEINCDIFKKFDYTALGHLHCAQSAGYKNIRYSGSILKYSLSEINQKKVFTILDIKDKKITLGFKDIEFLRDIKCYRGKLNEFLNKDFYSKIKTDDYIYFILEDEGIIDAKKELSTIYPNIMLLEFDNDFTRNLNNIEFKNKKENLSSEELFFDFFETQTNGKINDFQKKLIIDCFNNKEAIWCVL